MKKNEICLSLLHVSFKKISMVLYKILEKGVRGD